MLTEFWFDRAHRGKPYYIGSMVNMYEYQYWNGPYSIIIHARNIVTGRLLIIVNEVLLCSHLQNGYAILKLHDNIITLKQTIYNFCCWQYYNYIYIIATTVMTVSWRVYVYGIERDSTPHQLIKKMTTFGQQRQHTFWYLICFLRWLITGNCRRSR